MGRHPLAATSVAYALVVASIAGVPLTLGPGSAVAANHPASGPYAVGQYVPDATNGSAFECVEIQPLGDGTLTGPEYYDYGVDFSSWGTIDVQRPYLSQFYVYDGSDGANLVFLHGKVTNNTGGGGAVAFDVTGLPAGGELTVEDDDYELIDQNPANQSDSFDVDGSEALLNWRYGHNRTDGAVFNGLGGDGWTEITIDPTFGEEALRPNETWPQADEGPNTWVVRGGDGTNETLDMNEPVSLREGTCGSVAPSAELSAPSEATTEADVTLNASNPGSPTAPVTYEWDVEGDGNFSEPTGSPTVEHRYDGTGTVSPTVRVTDRYGNSATATTTITLVNDTPPTAVADVPETVPTGDDLTVDASGSSDETGIASYAWAFGDGGSATGVAATHVYDAMGNYTVTLTVTDDAGKTATDAANVTVTDGTPPEASLSVAPNTTAGSVVTLDASDSSDDVGVDRFEWTFGDGESATTTASAVNHEYASAGTYAPTVRVVDAAGNADTANGTITVSSPASGNETGDDTAATNDTAPSAAFVANETSVAAGEPIAFDATGSTDGDGDLVGWDWDFGDGEDGAGETVVHAFDAGDYTVTLTVYDDAGASDAATGNVTVTAANESDSDLRSDDGGGSQDGGGSDGSNDGGSDSSDDTGGSPSGSSGGSRSSSGGGGSTGGGGGGGGAPASEDTGEPAYAVTALSTDRSSVVAGETVTVTATVRNEGDGAGVETVALVVGSMSVDRATVDLGPGEGVNLTFTARLAVPGEQTLRVGDRVAAVYVRTPAPATSVASMHVEDATIDAGGTTTVVATVTNRGEAPGRQTVTLRVFDEVVDRAVVSVDPGETRTVRFDQRFDAPGDYTVSVGDSEATVHVVGESTDAGDGTITAAVPDGSDRTTALGFVGVGGLALAGVAVLLSRRL